MAKPTPPAYDVHPGVAMVRKWADELPAKTGRTLDEWADLVRRKKFATPAAARDWLKAEYALGTVTAGQIVECAAGQQTWDGDPEVYLRNAAGYVDAQFAGAKAHLRPIAEAVIGFARGLGPDVKVCPCKSIIPLYRARVFAELKAAARDRLELALRLGEVPYTDTLILNPRAKGNDKLRHLIRLHTANDFDAAAKKWVRAAYQSDA